MAITTFDFKYHLSTLLSNPMLMRKENLLFPNLDDPFELHDLNSSHIGDINTGSYHWYTSIQECSLQDDLLFPGVCFNDGTNVTRLGVEPFMYCPGIFKRHIRYLPEAWIILGYVEPSSNYSPPINRSKYTSKDKQNDYHYIIDFIFKDYKTIQDCGFSFDLYLNNKNKPHNVVFKPVIQLIIGDCMGANKLCGRYKSLHGTEKLCRDCDVPLKQADNPNYICNFLTEAFMKSCSEEMLNSYSFHSINNTFWGINFGKYDKFGIYGATPPEQLHLFYLGICDVLVQGFVDKLSNENKACIDYMTVSVVSTYKHHNMEYFPRLTAFRNGFVKDVVPILTGRDKFAKVFLLYILLLQQQICRYDT